jgi:hypothetical protein
MMLEFPYNKERLEEGRQVLSLTRRRNVAPIPYSQSEVRASETATKEK